MIFHFVLSSEMRNNAIFTVIGVVLTLGITSTLGSVIADPLPFGKERLKDFFFLQNGTVFHQFVIERMFLPFYRNNHLTLESWSVWRYTTRRC